MSEWLSTGQLVDKLKVGEIAELEENAQIPMKYGPSYKHVFKKESGDISWCNKDGNVPSSMPLIMYGHTTKWKWRILPKYVSFDEAMKALKSGKTVVLYSDGTRYAIDDYELKIGFYGDLEELSFRTLLEGKWTIKEDRHDH